MTKTLQEYLEERIFCDVGVPRDSLSNVAAIYTLMASVERTRRDLENWKHGKPYPEDFALDQIPISIGEEDIRGYIRDFYESEGYDFAELNATNSPGPDMNFSMSEQELGINVSYNQFMRTCLVTVLDRSKKKD